MRLLQIEAFAGPGTCHRGADPVGLSRLKFFSLVLCCLLAARVHAQQSLTDPTLYTLDPSSPFNALEIASANTNQYIYDQLSAKCAVAATACTAAELSVLRIVTSLVDTANALLGKGPTGASYGLDITGLRLALRWTAATEVAAIGSINTKFAGNQLANIATRLSALRLISGGTGQVLAFRGAPSEATAALVSAGAPSGGGASADSSASSPFSMYVNESYDWGTKSPTVNEDAFAFDGNELTLGADYRFSPNIVAGGAFGYSKKRLDFNSDLSTVDGNIHADGYSGILYGMYELQNFYANLSAGYQRLSYDIDRRISYPSLNPVIPGVDSTALSNTASNSLLTSAVAGYTFNLRAFSIEPFVGVDYRHITVDPFQEQAHQTANPSVLTAFGVQVAPQTIKSFELSAGLKLQYVWSTRIGVFVPYINGAYYNQLSDKARTYTATYAGIAGEFGPQASFQLATDPSPGHFFTAAGGVSMVLAHGIQGFVQYSRLLQYTNYTDQVIGGGIRIEF